MSVGNARQLAAVERVMDRRYVYIPKRSREEQAAHPRYTPIETAEPERVWLLARGRGDAGYQHDPLAPLVHGQTGFIEDRGHDWHWRDGRLHYTPGGERDGGVWLCLVFSVGRTS